MKKLLLALIWFSLLGGLVYWSSEINGKYIAGEIDKSSIITTKYNSGGTVYYSFIYTEYKSGKQRVVKDSILDVNQQTMLRQGKYLKDNGLEITGLVLSWIAFVVYTVLYIIMIFCGGENSQWGKYECSCDCMMQHYCNFHHYSKKSSKWKNFWGLDSEG